MKSIRYSRYTGDDFGLSAEDLLKALADFFLESGFDNPYMQFSEMNQHSLEDLKRALEQALQRGDLFDQQRADQIREQLENMSEQQLDQLLSKLVQKLVDEGYITTEPKSGGKGDAKDAKIEVKVTDKSVDFLGFKTLKDLLGSLGRSSFGAHDTRDMSTGVESTGAAKRYEFGDTLNLDVGADPFLRAAPRRRETAAEPRIRRSLRPSERVSKLLRDGPDAGLQPQHDPLRRGSLYAREESRHGFGPPDPHAISRR